MAETTTAPAARGPAPAPSSGGGWPVIAGVALAVSLLVNVLMAWGAHLTFTYDEVDTLLLGRVALGMPVPHVDGAGYFPGWGLLVSPAWWLTDDPFTVFRVAIVLGLVVGAITVWPLTRLAARFGLTTAQGLVVAAVVMALPCRSVQSAFALSERLVFLMVTLTVLAAYRLWERPTHPRAALVALAAAGALLTHARLLVLVAVVAAWLVAFALRRVSVAASGLALLVLLTAAVEWLARHWNALLVPHGFTQEGHLRDNLEQPHLGLFARTLLGEAWMQLLAGLGIVAVGVVVAVVAAGRDLRARRVGPVVVVLASALGLWLASSLDWASPDDLFTANPAGQRLDVWLYGRYADPPVALLTLIGLCALVRGLPRLQLAWAWALAAVVALPSVLWLARDVPTWGSVSPAQIAGITPFWWALPSHQFPRGLVPSLTNDNRAWVIATLAAVAPLLLASVVRRRPLVVAAAMLAIAATASVSARHEVAEFRAGRGEVPAAVGTVRALLAERPDAAVAYDSACKTRKSQASAQRNYFMWWLLPTLVAKGWDGEASIVISCGAGAPSFVPGARPLDMGPFGTMWLLPES